MAPLNAAILTRERRASRLHGIYAIVNESAEAVALARNVLDGGIALLQYRAKCGIVADRLSALRRITHERGALLIVNDDVEAAVAFDCDGVHLGPDDDGFDAVARVRRKLGERLIGLSCGTRAEALEAQRAGADYAGVGCVFPTASKDDAGEPIGLDGLHDVAGSTALPVAAIGGITAENVGAVAATGVAMAAVIGAVAASTEPAAAARDLVRRWMEATR